MIVYGDRERLLPLEELSASLHHFLREAQEAPPGMAAREAWTCLVVEAGVGAQGLLDRERAQRGHDELSQLGAHCHALCRSAAQGLRNALEQRSFHAQGQELSALLTALAGYQVPEPLQLREPEGYAHYCLYPELYLHAAGELRARRPGERWCVLGIRSIGTSLGALVAAALDAQTFWTVRPVGHPFQRQLALGPQLAQRVLGDAQQQYAIVDEGPGLSGSSFAAVARYLESHGVAADRLHFFPSHQGEPGPHCDSQFRAQYLRASRYQHSFDGELADGGVGIVRWFDGVLKAPSHEPPCDLSGGAWRSQLYPNAELYPASNVPMEARKLLVQADGARWLLKFTGLGESAATFRCHARVLGEHGFTPELRAARYGFSLFPWLEGAYPLPLASLPRERLLTVLTDYLTFLAGFPKPAHAGARPSTLYHMLAHNLVQGLGDCPALPAKLAELEAQLPALEASHRPVLTDNKLDAHEWLLTPDGRLLKTDAAAHARGHDLVGCQDPAWDVAGAAVELELSEAERSQLIESLRARADVHIAAPKLAFFELAYLAFRMGQAALADGALQPWPDDRTRMQEQRSRYEGRIRRWLAS